MVDLTVIENQAPSEVTVRSVEEAWAYVILRRAELEGIVYGLAYEPCRFNLGMTSTGRMATYTPDFWYIDSGTHHLVVLEVVGFRKRERARGDALLRKSFPWVQYRTLDAGVLRDPRRATGTDPLFGLPLPIELRGISVCVSAGVLGRKAEAKFRKSSDRESEVGDVVKLTARECGGEQPMWFEKGENGWSVIEVDETVTMQ